MRREDAAAVARLHCVVLPDGFLVQLGPTALVEGYAGGIGAPGVVGFITQGDHEVGGFLLATTDTRVLFQQILLRRAPRLALAVLRAAWRRPAALGRVLETLRYPARREPADRPPQAELISIGVLPRSASWGMGRH